MSATAGVLVLGFLFCAFLAWKCVEIPAWLRETLEDYLMNDDRVYQEISDEEEGYAPRRRRFA